MIGARYHQQNRVSIPIGLLPRTMVVISLVALMLILPPRGIPDDRMAGFAYGFVPVYSGASISFHVNHHDRIVAAVAAEDLPTTALAASGLFDSAPVTDAAFGFDAAPSTLSSSELWALRLGSGILTYFGFVFATDRPKGQMGVPLVDESGGNIEGCLRVSTSTVPGAGLGLYAAQSMPKGTVLGTYPGVVLPLGQHSASSKVRDCPGCATYIWRFTDNQYIIDPTDHGDGTLKALCKGGNPSQPLSVVFFNVLFGLGLLRGVSTALCRINEPPGGRDVNVVTKEDLETRTVTFTLERDVFEGEELHIDYGLTYDRTGYGSTGESGM